MNAVERKPNAAAAPKEPSSAKPRRASSTASVESAGNGGGVRITLRPGRNLTRGIMLAAIPALLYFLLLWHVLAWLTGIWCVLLLAAAGQEAQLLRRQIKSLRLRRIHPPIAGRGLRFGVSWEITTDGSQTLYGELHGRLREVVPIDAAPRRTIHEFTLDAAQPSAVLTQSFWIVKRGRHPLGPTWLRVLGPRGLVEAQRSFAGVSTIRVMPEKFTSREELLKDDGAAAMLLDQRTRSRQHGAGTEFESLSEFREGDDPRRIDWRATARRGHLIVRRFQVERHRDVMLLVDCGRLMGIDALRGTKLDCAVDTALLLARTVLQAGDRCGLALFDDRLLGYLPPVSGMPSLNALVEAAFDVQSNFKETDFGPIFAELQTRQTKRSLIVVLSDVADAETSRQFQASLAELSKRHVVIFAALRTPALEQVVREPVNELLDAARKTVVFRILRERRQTLHALRKAGVHVLDLEPAQLTVPLLNYYLDLRSKSLL